jgi:phosphopantetheinyl transferase (holo-ACP synthase)
LFLDVEGVPDEDLDYLIGLNVSEGDQVTEFSFWADSGADEVAIFKNCLEVAAKYPDAPIFHYGSYEARSFARVRTKHGIKCDWFTKRLVNVNAAIFGKVYFPARSNRLKDLGHFLGASWSEPEASGLLSLVWRQRWEETGARDDKQRCPRCGGPHGRPTLAGADVHLSMAHAGGFVVAAASAMPIGVDIEPIDLSSHNATLMATVMTRGELDTIRRSSSPATAFLQLWVRKEALIKAGLATLDRLRDVDLSDFPLAEPTEPDPVNSLGPMWPDVQMRDWQDRSAAIVGSIVSSEPAYLRTFEKDAWILGANPLRLAWQ